MIDTLIEPFRYEFMLQAFGVGTLIAIVCAILSCFLVLRGWSLMGDAISHAVLPGIVLAYIAGIPLALGAFASGLLCAVSTGWIKANSRIKEDTVMGVVFTGMFAVGLVLFSKTPSELHLDHILFGNILGVSGTDLQLAALASATTLAVFIVFYRPILLETFDPIFLRATGGRGGLVHVGILCLTVLNLIAALQAMGIVLSLGLFLLPAVTAYLWCDRLARMLVLSVILALTGSVLGILGSYHLGLASGASIVLSLGVFFLFSAAFSPRYGLGALLLQKLRAGKVVLRETP